MNWDHVNFSLPPKGPVYRGLTVTVIDNWLQCLVPSSVYAKLNT